MTDRLALCSLRPYVRSVVFVRIDWDNGEQKGSVGMKPAVVGCENERVMCCRLCGWAGSR
jgi:hypothetical protein